MALQQPLAMKKGTTLSYNKKAEVGMVEKLSARRSIINPFALLSEKR